MVMIWSISTIQRPRMLRVSERVITALDRIQLPGSKAGLVPAHLRYATKSHYFIINLPSRRVAVQEQ